MDGINIGSFLDEIDDIVKRAGYVTDVAMPWLKANKKPLALVGGGAAAALAGKRGIDDIMMAEQMRKMQRG
jgi:hypothetical protein